MQRAHVLNATNDSVCESLRHFEGRAQVVWDDTRKLWGERSAKLGVVLVRRSVCDTAACILYNSRNYSRLGS